LSHTSASFLLLFASIFFIFSKIVSDDWSFFFSASLVVFCIAVSMTPMSVSMILLSNPHTLSITKNHSAGDRAQVSVSRSLIRYSLLFILLLKSKTTYQLYYWYHFDLSKNQPLFFGLLFYWLHLIILLAIIHLIFSQPQVLI